jgi:hypothetical protein
MKLDLRHPSRKCTHCCMVSRFEGLDNILWFHLLGSIQITNTTETYANLQGLENYPSLAANPFPTAQQSPFPLKVEGLGMRLDFHLRHPIRYCTYCCMVSRFVSPDNSKVITLERTTPPSYSDHINCHVFRNTCKRTGDLFIIPPTNLCFYSPTTLLACKRSL